MDNAGLRIGVFVCHCGTNIAGPLDVAAVAEYAEGLPGVIHVQQNKYSCSEGGLKEIQQAIREKNLDRLVVSACSPRTHEPLFRQACQEAGLNPFLFEFVNIRDQCSWVHQKNRKGGTKKAKDLLRMGVARSRQLHPQEEIAVEVIPVSLIIGGGIAGISAALSLARCGFRVKLVEKEDQLGGLLRGLYRLHDGLALASDVLDPKLTDLQNHPGIDVYTGAQVAEVQGSIGKYQIKLDSGVQLEVGTVVVATGAQPWRPVGRYGYDGRQVITQWELEEKLQEGSLEASSVVMIQCVGAREEGRPYCSKICCSTAIKNALLVKEASPNSQVYILYRDIQTYGADFEDEYARARQQGIVFLQYDPKNPPSVQGGSVTFFCDVLGEDLEVPCDLLVLSTPLAPPEGSEELAKLLKVPRDGGGFFFEAHAKLRPVEFATDGVYLCGAARWPAFVGESVFQAEAAASRAAIPLTNRLVQVEPIVATVDQEVCRGCGRCAEVCPYQAHELEEISAGLAVTRINQVLCKGCGVCTVECPSGAITAQHYTDEQIEAMLVVLGEE